VNTDDRSNTRKRLLNNDKWKATERKKKHQSGQEYTNKRGKRVLSKRVSAKKDCLNTCKFHCSKDISQEDRQVIFDSYYTLKQNEKHLFLLQNTERKVKGRKTKQGVSRRSYSFFYYFTPRRTKVRVCKSFFLTTLCISQKPIYHVHENLNVAGVPKKDGRGKHPHSNHAISDAKRQHVITHIKSFPVVESHYCRSNIKRKYLESTLTLKKMYNFYDEDCKTKHEKPVKLSMYRKIFVSNFNYGFHVPKKDQCEKCYTFMLKKTEQTSTDEEKRIYEDHVFEKTKMRESRNADRQDKSKHVLTFDLENVITCPRTEIGTFFYLQKINLYNLTAHLSSSNTVYCAIWTEVVQGRTGNCLASAFSKIVERVLHEHHEITDLTTWSDSCVPQNRNSFISAAVMNILKRHPTLQTITMKYSIPGHGAVQEVDGIHSKIENYMKKAEFFSPLGFVRNLKKVDKNFIIIQMKESDFKNYDEFAQHFNYTQLPFTKVISIGFSQKLFALEYKTSHGQNDYPFKINIKNEPKTRRCKKKTSTKNEPFEGGFEPILKTLSKKQPVSKEKIEAIKKMMPSMPQIDKAYFEALLNIRYDTKKSKNKKTPPFE
jgi:hypothetical protein